jgi:Fungal chitosanase of glycosyl hydrolase group 75
MRKQVIYTIVSGLLYASGFAQSGRIPGEARLMHPRSTGNSVGWMAALAGNFEDTWKNVNEPLGIEGRANGCALARSRLMKIVFVSGDRDPRHLREVPVWQLPDSRDFFFISGMTIDADGAPNAYSPDDTGLDELANAGAPGHWDGIITDRSGNALIQQERDPFPGYYISCTSLSDETKHFTDPTGYVNASKIPYVVLPKDVAERGGAKLGDFAVVVNLRNGKSSFAIYADIGTLGEGSVALADALGIWSDARHGGASDNILYLLFPGSGNRKPRTLDEIQNEGKKAVYRWGGTKGLPSCLESYSAAVVDGRKF